MDRDILKTIKEYGTSYNLTKSTNWENEKQIVLTVIVPKIKFPTPLEKERGFGDYLSEIIINPRPRKECLIINSFDEKITNIPYKLNSIENPNLENYNEELLMSGTNFNEISDLVFDCVEEELDVRLHDSYFTENHFKNNYDEEDDYDM